jgi:hypothetical protein
MLSSINWRSTYEASQNETFNGGQYGINWQRRYCIGCIGMSEVDQYPQH